MTQSMIGRSRARAVKLPDQSARGRDDLSTDTICPSNPIYQCTRPPKVVAPLVELSGRFETSVARFFNNAGSCQFEKGRDRRVT